MSQIATAYIGLTKQDSTLAVRRVSFARRFLVDLSIADRQALLESLFADHGPVSGLVSDSGAVSGSFLSKLVTVARIMGDATTTERVLGVEVSGTGDRVGLVYAAYTSLVRSGKVAKLPRSGDMPQADRDAVIELATRGVSKSELEGNGDAPRMPREPKVPADITDAIRRAIARGVTVDRIVQAIDSL